MPDILHPNQKIICDSGAECQVEKMLGGGTQGEVYLSKYKGQRVALKWYYVEGIKEYQYYNLQKLVEAGSPAPTFLWPLDLCSSPDAQGFGYIMPLRSPNVKSINDWMFRKIHPSFEALLTAGYNLAKSFHCLHYRGMCYRDINFGNAFFNPDTGEVEICDNDNASVDAHGSLVLGTPDFMAPEVVRGEAQPSAESDRFSLAVLLHYMFFLNHPLYGKKLQEIHCLDNNAKTMLCGHNPVYIFDPHDRSNEALTEHQDSLRESGANAIEFRKIYPGFFNDLFARSFTDGLRYPQARVQEVEWMDAFVKLRDLIVHCPDCKAENFYNPDLAVKQTNGEEHQRCWQCREKIPIHKMRITTPQKTMVVVLDPDNKKGKYLYPHHTEDQEYNFSTPTATVVKHPRSNAIGLENKGAKTWTINPKTSSKNSGSSTVTPQTTNSGNQNPTSTPAQNSTQPQPSPQPQDSKATLTPTTPSNNQDPNNSQNPNNNPGNQPSPLNQPGNQQPNQFNNQQPNQFNNQQPNQPSSPSSNPGVSGLGTSESLLMDESLLAHLCSSPIKVNSSTPPLPQQQPQQPPQPSQQPASNNPNGTSTGQSNQQQSDSNNPNGTSSPSSPSNPASNPASPSPPQPPEEPDKTVGPGMIVPLVSGLRVRFQAGVDSEIKM